jgi:hypothetical protein
MLLAGARFTPRFTPLAPFAPRAQHGAKAGGALLGALGVSILWECLWMCPQGRREPLDAASCNLVRRRGDLVLSSSDLDSAIAEVIAAVIVVVVVSEVGARVQIPTVVSGGACGMGRRRHWLRALLLTTARRQQRLRALLLTTARRQQRLRSLVLTTARRQQRLRSLLLTTAAFVAFDLALELPCATSCDLVRRRGDLVLPSSDLALELPCASPWRRRDGCGAHHGASASAARGGHRQLCMVPHRAWLQRTLRSTSCDLVRARASSSNLVRAPESAISFELV